MSCAARWALIACALVSTPAAAIDPTFIFATPEQVDAVEWSSQAKAGLMLSTGNSQTTSLNAGISASRKSNDNKVSGEANVTFARSAQLIATDENGSGTIDPGELHRVTQTTTESWLLKGRYDRFFAETNSVYGTGRASADPPAGKEFLGGAQLGFSRRLFAVGPSTLTAELGYDFTYEKYVKNDEPVVIHSAHAALLHETKLNEFTQLNVDAELLVNLNREVAPNPNGTNVVPPLADYRVNATAGLTTRIIDRISLGLTFKLRYDHVPAPRPTLGLPYAPGFTPFADRLDTTTEASLIFTLL